MLPACRALHLLILAVPYLGEDCGTSRKDFSTWQPCRLSAQAGASITLPCNFSHPWKESPKASVGVHWRLGEFHSKAFLFNYTATGSHTHPNYSGRVSLVGDPLKGHEASIRILNLSESDSNVYFCRVSVQIVKKREEWQSIGGTNLTVTSGAPTPPYSILGTAAGAALATMAASLGLLVFLAWRKGFCQGCPQARRTAAKCKEKPEGTVCEEVGFPEAIAPHVGGPATTQSPSCPPTPPVEPHLLYATLTLSDAKSNTPASPQKGPGCGGQETTYAILQH